MACHGANSTLNTRLYRHLSSEEQHRFGFANSVILSNSYVVGTTRHPLPDSLVLASFAAMLLGLLAHGLGRFVTRQKHAVTADEPAAEPVYLISLWVRLWHWFNAALIVILSVTGFSLHFADPALPLVDFALAVRVHNAAGVTLVGTYVFFFFFANILSGNWRQFVPKLDGIVQRVLAQGLWYASASSVASRMCMSPTKKSTSTSCRPSLTAADVCTAAGDHRLRTDLPLPARPPIPCSALTGYCRSPWCITRRSCHRVLPALTHLPRHHRQNRRADVQDDDHRLAQTLTP